MRERDDILQALEDSSPEILDLVWDMGFVFDDLSLYELEEEIVQLYTGVGASSWDARLEDGWFHAMDVPGDDTEELYFSFLERTAEGYARDKYDDPAVMDVEVPWTAFEPGSGREEGKVYRSEDVSTNYFSVSYPSDWVSGIEEV